MGYHTTSSLLAWHFVGDTLRDGRPVPADGVWLVHDGPVVLCKSGLHASVDVWHALQYAPGGTLCHVELAGTIVHAGDKVVANQRRILARIDAAPLLRAFARRCALDVIHLWDAPDIVREYLETGREDLRDAARAAAWDAARAAAWAASRDAARAAAWDAARAVAWDASRAVAWDASRDAARAAAWDAARAASRDAARDAARAAARAASEEKQAAHFRALVAEAFRDVQP